MNKWSHKKLMQKVIGYHVIVIRFRSKNISFKKIANWYTFIIRAIWQLDCHEFFNELDITDMGFILKFPKV